MSCATSGAARRRRRKMTAAAEDLVFTQDGRFFYVYTNSRPRRRKGGNLAGLDCHLWHLHLCRQDGDEGFRSAFRAKRTCNEGPLLGPSLKTGYFNSRSASIDG